MAPRVGLAVPAAGIGRRMGRVRKPWIELAGEPLLRRALRPFLEHPAVSAVRIAVARDEIDDLPGWLTRVDPRVAVVAGGETRALSVREAVRALPDVDVVMVHDAARPFVDRAMIDRCLDSLSSTSVQGAVAAVPVTDTIKVVDAELRVLETPPRAQLWNAQTPQAFNAEAFRAACERLEQFQTAGEITDDASLMEAAGHAVVLVPGSPSNIKVTRPEDVRRAELILQDADGR